MFQWVEGITKMDQIYQIVLYQIYQNFVGIWRYIISSYLIALHLLKCYNYLPY